MSFHHPAYVSNGKIASNGSRRLPYQAWAATDVMQGHVHASEIIEKTDPLLGTLPYFIVGERAGSEHHRHG